MGRIVVDRGRRIGPQVAVDAAESMTNHVPVRRRVQPFEEGHQVIEVGRHVLRQQWPKAHHRLLHVVEKPARKAVQQVEIRLQLRWQPPARRHQPGVQSTARHRPVQERHGGHQIERQGNGGVELKRGCAGDEFTHQGPPEEYQTVGTVAICP